MASRWLTPLEDWFKLKVFPPRRAASSCGGRPCGFRPMRTRRNWKPNGLSWNGG